jgi:DNA replication and repair protein RecF
VISDLTLSHFRSHRRTALVFDGRPVAIWGPNGAGKTNILEALSLLSPGRGLRRAAPEDLMRRPEALGWKVTAIVAGHEVQTFAEGPVGRTVLIDGKPATQTALGRILRMLWLVPAMDRLWIEGADGRRRFLDRMTLSFDPGHAEAVLTYEKAMRERNRLLKDGVRDTGWYGALESRMAASGAAIQSARAGALARVTAAQAGADSAFPAARLAVVAPEGAGAVGQDALTQALAEGRARDQAAGRTLAGPHRDDLDAVWADKDMPAAQCSTGEQKALLISLILSNARALKSMTGTPPVILLDEVAAHLDHGRRAALYDEVTALGAQAFMTGTGVELFAGLDGRAQGLSVIDRAGISDAAAAAIA